MVLDGLYLNLTIIISYVIAQLAPLSAAASYNFVCQKYCDVRGSTFKCRNLSNASVIFCLQLLAV
jgi:hypothetical protein